jgi:hypothetical protein
MSIFFAIIMIPATYMTNGILQNKYSELNYTARFMVLSEYAEETETSSYGDYRVNAFNYYQLKSRYDEFISSIDNKRAKEIYTCLETQGETCKNIKITEKDGDITLTFESELSEDAIQYISKLSLERKIINEYSYGANKIIFRWA